jgi:propanol-preferring alcohol dehydrogenase
MRAMLLRRPGTPLEQADVNRPSAAAGQVLIRVEACAVCRTDLHVADGELLDPKLPLILGHQIVGTVEETGERIGVPWLAWTCGTCRYCAAGQENLCDRARFTGYTVDGGFTEWTVAEEQYTFQIPRAYSSIEAAPLLCSGLIGYRALRMCADAETIGFFGFGSAAHILVQVTVHQGRRVFAFTRPGDQAGQQFALSLGASWAGASTDRPEQALDAAIIFAPVGELVPVALRNLRKGGVVVCAGIHMTDIPSFPYELLWGERSVRSVANLTRSDGAEFFRVAAEFPIKVETQTYELSRANEALDDLRQGRIRGAAVLVP